MPAQSERVVNPKSASTTPGTVPMYNSLMIAKGNTPLRYTVVLEPTNEPDQIGWYYAHVPALDLTTHGLGVEGAVAAAQELVEGWLAELIAQGKPVPREEPGFASTIEVNENALRSA